MARKLNERRIPRTKAVPAIRLTVSIGSELGRTKTTVERLFQTRSEGVARKLNETQNTGSQAVTAIRLMPWLGSELGRTKTTVEGWLASRSGGVNRRLAPNEDRSEQEAWRSRLHSEVRAPHEERTRRQTAKISSRRRRRRRTANKTVNATRPSGGVSVCEAARFR